MPQQKKQNGFARTVGLLGVGFTGMMLASLLACSLLGVAAVWMFGGTDMNLLMVINDLGMYGIGLPVLLAVGHFLPNGAAFPLWPRHALRPSTFGKAAAVGYAGCMVANVVTSIVVALIRTLAGLPASSESLDNMLDGLSPWASLLLISVVPAVAEELLFRGYLYRKLIRFGQLPYILLSAFFFGSFHGNLDQFLYAFLLGCWLGYLVCRTGSVFYGMMIHLLINFFSSCVLTGVGDGAIINGLLGLVILGVVIWGAIQFWDFHRRMFVRPSTGLPDHPVRAAVLNPGMLLWVVVFLVVSAMSLLS